MSVWQPDTTSPLAWTGFTIGHTQLETADDEEVVLMLLAAGAALPADSDRLSEMVKRADSKWQKLPCRAGCRRRPPTAAAPAASHMQRLPQRPQRRLLHRLAQGRMRVDGVGDVFQLRAHLE